MKKILVVDDFSPNQFILSKLLDKYGYYYEFADNGVVAIEKLKSETYDLVMMDIQMPVMNGIETLEFIRGSLQNENRNVIVVAITGHNEPEYVEFLNSCGFNYVLEKPFRREELSIFLQDLFHSMDDGAELPENMIYKPDWLDLDYLENYAQGDEQFLHEIVLLFESTIKELLDNSRKGLIDNNWTILRMSVHKMASQLNFMGIKHWKTILNEAECNYEKMIEFPKIELYLQDIEKDCITAIEYLKFKYKIV